MPWQIRELGKEPKLLNLSEELQKELLSLSKEEQKRITEMLLEPQIEFFRLLYNIDCSILRYCTKFSHWTQRTFGITNYAIARLGCGSTAIGVAIDLSNYFNQFLDYRTSLFLVTADVCWLAVLVYRSFICTKAEEQTYSGARTKINEILTYDSWWLRLYFLVFFALFVPIDILNTLTAKLHFLQFLRGFPFGTGLVIFYYFIAVDPLPPGQSKVKEFIKSLFKSLKPVQEGC